MTTPTVMGTAISRDRLDRDRERRERDDGSTQVQQQQVSSHSGGSAAVASLQKTVAASSGGGATPRRREKKDKDKEADIVKRLQMICTPADPTKLYRNLVKIGAG